MKHLNRLLTLFAVLTLAAGFAGCGDDSEPEVEPTPALQGSWGGSAGGVTINLTLAQSGESVSGSGTINGDGGSGSLSASGTNVYPNVALTLKSTGYYDINFSGRFADSKTVAGTLHGSGFEGEGFILTKR